MNNHLLIGWNILFIFCISIFFNSVNAQETENSTEKKDWRFIAAFDNRRTQIRNQHTLIYGGFIGIYHKDRYRYKFGIAGTPFKVGESIDEFNKIQRNRFYIFNLGHEADFLIINRFRMTSYLQLGVGENFYYSLDVNTENAKKEGKHIFVPLEIGTHFNYDVLKWLRFKIGGGWRFSLNHETRYLSGYYIKLGFAADMPKLLNIYRDWENKKEDLYNPRF